MAAQERARDVWIVPWFRDACQDIRFTVRSLIKDRAFTTASILILALGIGATTAIFSAVYAVLLQPLPYWGPSAARPSPEEEPVARVAEQPDLSRRRNRVAPGEGT